MVNPFPKSVSFDAVDGRRIGGRSARLRGSKSVDEGPMVKRLTHTFLRRRSRTHDESELTTKEGRKSDIAHLTQQEKVFCLICLDPMKQVDLAHPLMCKSTNCCFNFAASASNPNGTAPGFLTRSPPTLSQLPLGPQANDLRHCTSSKGRSTRARRGRERQKSRYAQGNRRRRYFT